MTEPRISRAPSARGAQRRNSRAFRIQGRHNLCQVDSPGYGSFRPCHRIANREAKTRCVVCVWRVARASRAQKVKSAPRTPGPLCERELRMESLLHEGTKLRFGDKVRRLRD